MSHVMILHYSHKPNFSHHNPRPVSFSDVLPNRSLRIGNIIQYELRVFINSGAI